MGREYCVAGRASAPSPSGAVGAVAADSRRVPSETPAGSALAWLAQRHPLPIPRVLSYCALLAAIRAFASRIAGLGAPAAVSTYMLPAREVLYLYMRGIASGRSSSR